MKNVIMILTTVLLSITVSLGQRTRTTLKFNSDSLKMISEKNFNKLVDQSIELLETKKLVDISDSGHIYIMMCLNTIFMAHDTAFQRRFRNGRYEKLEHLSEVKNYITDITKVYKEWTPNRGMGFYFPKLKMELYGTPRLYAWFQVKD